MHNGLFQLGISANELRDILQHLKVHQTMSERNKEHSLRNYLNELGIIVPSTRERWQLVDTRRLDILLVQLDQQIQKQVIGKKENSSAIIRRMQRIHHKSASAWRGSSKAGQGEPLAKGQIVTHDDILRIRSQGTGIRLTFSRNSQQNHLYPDTESEWRSECILPERMLLDLDSVDIASARLIMTVENLGAFVDMPLVDRLVVILTPGQNYQTVCQWISRYCQSVPWVHFPDIDPNGLRMAQQIARKLERPCHIWLPDFWSNAHRVSDMVGMGKYLWEMAPDCPQLAQLRRELRWIEQEVLVLDYRCIAAIQRLVNHPDDEITVI